MIVIKTNKVQIRDSDTNSFSGIDMVSSKTVDEELDEIIMRISETLDSIPEDYTELSEHVYSMDDILDAIDKELKDTYIGVDGITYTSVGDAVRGQITSMGKKLIDTIYPIGSIYSSIKPTSPAELFGGSWQEIAPGRVLIGVNDDYPVGSTGGSEKRTILTENIPSHGHGERLEWIETTTSGYSLTGFTPVKNGQGYLRVDADGSSTKLTGGGEPIDTMPPYFAVYRWVRISGSLVPITGLSIPSTMTVHVSGTAQISPSYIPVDTTETGLSWSSSAPNIASVSQNGLITWVSDGNAVITVTSTENTNVKASCTVTCEKLLPVETVIPITAISLIPPDAEYSQINVIYTPENTTQRDIYWTSSNPNIATVSATGGITWLSYGNVTITAQSMSNEGVYASINIARITTPSTDLVSDKVVIPDMYNTGYDGPYTYTLPDDVSGEIQNIIPGVQVISNSGVLKLNCMNVKDGDVKEIEGFDLCNNNIKYLQVLNANDRNITLKFKNCRIPAFNPVSGPAMAVKSNVKYEFDHCDFDKGCAAAENSKYTACRIHVKNGDGVWAYLNCELYDCYVYTDYVGTWAAGQHVDVLQTIGTTNFQGESLIVENCNFSLPYMNVDTGTAYPNACLMIKPDYSDYHGIDIRSLYCNGGGYAVYLSPQVYTPYGTVSNIEVGCMSRYGKLYPKISTEVTGSEHIVDASTCYIGTVKKTDDGVTVYATNYTNEVRVLHIITNNSTYTQNVPACPTCEQINADETLYTSIDEFPFNIPITIPTCNWVKVYDGIRLIRTVVFNGSDVSATTPVSDEIVMPDKYSTGIERGVELFDLAANGFTGQQYLKNENVTVLIDTGYASLDGDALTIERLKFDYDAGNSMNMVIGGNVSQYSSITFINCLFDGGIKNRSALVGINIDPIGTDASKWTYDKPIYFKHCEFTGPLSGSAADSTAATIFINCLAYNMGSDAFPQNNPLSQRIGCYAYNCGTRNNQNYPAIVTDPANDAHADFIQSSGQMDWLADVMMPSRNESAIAAGGSPIYTDEQIAAVREKYKGTSKVYIRSCRSDLIRYQNSDDGMVYLSNAASYNDCDYGDITVDCDYMWALGGSYTYRYEVTQGTVDNPFKICGNAKHMIAGCINEYGNLHSTVYSGTGGLNEVNAYITNASTVLVGSVWSEDDVVNVSVTNYTNTARSFRVETNLGSTNFEIEKCPLQSDLTDKTVYKPFSWSKFPFDRLYTIPSTGVKWVKVYDGSTLVRTAVLDCYDSLTPVSDENVMPDKYSTGIERGVELFDLATTPVVTGDTETMVSGRIDIGKTAVLNSAAWVALANAGYVTKGETELTIERLAFRYDEGQKMQVNITGAGINQYSKITFRNCLFDGGTGLSSGSIVILNIDPLGENTALWTPDKPILFEHCEFTGKKASSAIRPDAAVTFDHCLAHDIGADAFPIDNALAKRLDCYGYNLGMSAGAHADFIQSSGGMDKLAIDMRKLNQTQIDAGNSPAYTDAQIETVADKYDGTSTAYIRRCRGDIIQYTNLDGQLYLSNAVSYNDCDSNDRGTGGITIDIDHMWGCGGNYTYRFGTSVTGVTIKGRADNLVAGCINMYGNKNIGVLEGSTNTAVVNVTNASTVLVGSVWADEGEVNISVTNYTNKARSFRVETNLGSTDFSIEKCPLQTEFSTNLGQGVWNYVPTAWSEFPFDRLYTIPASGVEWVRVYDGTEVVRTQVL